MKRINRRKDIKLFILLILLLVITIGYALVSTTLKITGNATITKQTWSVYWGVPTVTEGSVTTTPPTRSEDSGDPANTKLTWSTTLSLPGDYYEFEVDAVNAGTIDAMITGITPTVSPALPTNPDYIKYSVTYADGITPALNHLLPKADQSTTPSTPTTEKYKVRVYYDEAAATAATINNMSSSTTYTFTLNITYGQATDEAIPKPVWVLPNGRTKDNLQVGDEICAKGECFNFVRYDGNNAVMLAKYNLKVGYIYDDDDVEQGRYTNSTAGYNKQSSDAKGYVAGETRYGTVAFAATNYWWDSENYEIKPKYGNDFDTNNVYDTDYTTEPDFSTTCSYMSHNCFYTPGYSAAYYVEEYKEILEGLGATIESTRLLTYEDVEDASIGCSWSGCPTTGTGSFVTRTSFWLASAADEATIIYIDTTGNLMDSTFGNDREFGVRPVIVVAKSNL